MIAAQQTYPNIFYTMQYTTVELTILWILKYIVGYTLTLYFSYFYPENISCS